MANLCQECKILCQKCRILCPEKSKILCQKCKILCQKCKILCHNVCFRCSLLLFHCDDYDLQGGKMWKHNGNRVDYVSHSGNMRWKKMHLKYLGGCSLSIEHLLNLSQMVESVRRRRAAKLFRGRASFKPRLQWKHRTEAAHSIWNRVVLSYLNSFLTRKIWNLNLSDNGQHSQFLRRFLIV